MTVALQEIVGWIEEAGRRLLDAQRGMTGAYKADGTVASEMDRATQRDLVGRLRAAFPEAGILAEEDDLRQEGEGTWILDPLDGTRNYLLRMNHWAISLAGLGVRGQDFAVLSAPALGRLWARQGRDHRVVGAWDFPLPPTRAQACLDVGSDAHRALDLGEWPGKITITGAAALAVMRVAEGELIGAVLTRYQVWDVAAAFLVSPERLAAWDLASDAEISDLRTLLADLAAGATPPPLLVADPGAITALRAEIRLR